MKKITIFLGILGLLLYVLGYVLGIEHIYSEAQMVSYEMECLDDWSSIDGPRFTVGEVAWTKDGTHFRFHVTKNAFWPCSRSETYIARADGTDVRILEDSDSFDWFQSPDPTRPTSPSGRKLIGWDGMFWAREEFYLAIIDLDENRKIELSMEELLEDLEQRALNECGPEICRDFDVTHNRPWNPGILLWVLGLIMPLGLICMTPALWIRREKLLAKLGMVIIGLHIVLNELIVIMLIFKAPS